jgi:DNA processing protein
MTPNYTALLAHFPKLTYRRFHRLIDNLGSAETAWHAEIGELAQVGWEEGIARDFIAWREQANPEKILERLATEGIVAISYGDPDYPLLLKQLPDPPVALFVRGKLPPVTHPALSIVGTRKSTPYGKQVTLELSSELARKGLVLVSGLALGTDSFVHEATVEAGGITLAVLGSGVDRLSLYPRAHHGLAERIIATGGALLSEYPPGFLPTAYSFPARNRIIAGLTRATLVTEAPRESGALITARAALDYNREVLAVPHPITSPTGEGTNLLIQQGAHVILKAADVLEVLDIKDIEQTLKSPQPSTLSPDDTKILALLSKEPIHIDRITKDSGLPSTKVSSTLLLLEMKGYIKNTGGHYYIRRI